MGRIQGLAESGLLSEDVLVKGAPGYVFSITIAWTGAAAGNRCYLRDSLTKVANPATIEAVFCLPTTNGTITKEWPQGKQFETGIYWDQGDAPDGTLFAELTFK